MKKLTKTKLALKIDTLRILNSNQLQTVIGGASGVTVNSKADAQALCHVTAVA